MNAEGRQNKDKIRVFVLVGATIVFLDVQSHMYYFPYFSSTTYPCPLSFHESDHHQLCYHLFASFVTDFMIITSHTYVSLFLQPYRQMTETNRLNYFLSVPI